MAPSSCLLSWGACRLYLAAAGAEVGPCLCALQLILGNQQTKADDLKKLIAAQITHGKLKEELKKAGIPFSKMSDEEKSNLTKEKQTAINQQDKAREKIKKEVDSAVTGAKVSHGSSPAPTILPDPFRACKAPAI